VSSISNVSRIFVSMTKGKATVKMWSSLVKSCKAFQELFRLSQKASRAAPIFREFAEVSLFNGGISPSALPSSEDRAALSFASDATRNGRYPPSTPPRS